MEPILYAVLFHLMVLVASFRRHILIFAERKSVFIQSATFCYADWEMFLPCFPSTNAGFPDRQTQRWRRWSAMAAVEVP